MVLQSLAHGRCGCNLKLVILKFKSSTDILSISCDNFCRWMLQDLTDDLSALVQVMAWCHHQTTSNCLSQCWSRSLSPYGVIRPQSVNVIINIVQKIKWKTILCLHYNHILGMSIWRALWCKDGTMFNHMNIDSTLIALWWTMTYPSLKGIS